MTLLSMDKRGNQLRATAQRGYAMLAIIAAVGVATTAVPTYGVLIGGTAAMPNNGTMAVSGFNGVSTAYTNFQSTVLSAAIQQTPSGRQ
jgi:hypothetical protein